MWMWNVKNKKCNWKKKKKENPAPHGSGGQEDSQHEPRLGVFDESIMVMEFEVIIVLYCSL